MTIDKRLKTYKGKRNFSNTTEPSGSDRRSPGRDPIFVIQKHQARNLHFDFRLEIDGVLVSWAVPKGPSTDPKEKRLAVQVEDHPLAYADFEGVIPEGEYGAGTVMVWDSGTYENIHEDDNGLLIPMKTSLDNGHIVVRLKGQKLKGGYALTRFKKQSKQWLLVKMRDAEADARRNPVNTENKSVLSGKSLHAIRKAGRKS